MDLFFADDARQNRPSRVGMGPLVAAGGIYVPAESVRMSERALDKLCADYGFPPQQEFKWSPGRELWMYDSLVAERRTQFFIDALTIAERANARAVVIVEDTQCKTATDADSPEEDVTRLLIERMHNQLLALNSEGIVIVDRPGGNRAREDKFLAGCLETLQKGTDYVRPERITLNVLCTSSTFVRLLQLADVVTSCSLALVAGESTFAPPVFAVIKRLLPTELKRIGGVGLKIHPDLKYANLYHWLLGDSHFLKHGSSISLPVRSYPYSTDPDNP